MVALMTRDMRDAHETARARDERDFLLSLGPEDARKWRVAQEVVARTVEFVRSAAFPGETTSADAHATTRARDASLMLAALNGTGEPRARTHDDFHREWLHVMDTQHPHTPQESDMPTITRTITVRLDPELVALLTEIRDRLPERVEVKVAPFDPDVIAANLEAIKHEVETPMRGHGECCEPADITEEPPVGPGVRMVTIRWDDARKLLNLARTAWRVAGRGDAHPTRLDQRTSAALDAAPLTEPSVNVTETPDLSTEDAGTSSEPAPADDLPGEPVEPGDLRAGDRVAYTYRWKRYEGALVVTTMRRQPITTLEHAGLLVTFEGRWAGGISDVRLIERAPADVDPDEGLIATLRAAFEGRDEMSWAEVARVAREHVDDANFEWAQYRKDYGVDPTDAAHKAFHAGFKAAQKCAKDGGWSGPVDTAPADVDPDEALALVAYNAFTGGRDDSIPLGLQADWRDAARAAREHIEDSLKVYYRDLYDKAEAALADMTRQRDTLRDRVDELLRERQGFIRERDEWQARHAALRADVDEFQYRHRGHPSTWELVDALGRDNERAES